MAAHVDARYALALVPARTVKWPNAGSSGGAFLATAARGTYAACYRGETLGLEPAGEAAYTALAA